MLTPNSIPAAIRNGLARYESWLLPSVGLYLLCTLFIQWLAATPSTIEGSPVDVSSDLVASLGLALASWQARQHWGNRLVRGSWFAGCAGMFLIWCAETAADQFAPDFRLVIAVWAIALVFLYRALRPYMGSRNVAAALWSGAASQLIAHAVWLFLIGPHRVDSGLHPLVAAIDDVGELCALLFYLVAFVLANASDLNRHSTDGGRVRRWAARRSIEVQADRPRVCFSFIAQNHQVLHSLPIAVSLAQRRPDMDVHIAGSADRLRFVRDMLNERGIEAPLALDELQLPLPIRFWKRGAVGGKKWTMRKNRLYFSSFDAIVVPERTSTYLRRICPNWTRLIGTEHGAGDRQVTFAPEIALYDFVLLPGQKQAKRLLELGYARREHLATGIYAKLDWTQGPCKPLFANDRPTVLYNPHFEEGLSSWHRVGWQVLDYFARSTQYNLIFAPHMRLFDAPTAAKYRLFKRYLDLPHLHIDLGSARCLDMSYTRQADIYLGDVSSQVVEFLTRPRPCVFLNAWSECWQNDPHYRFWNLGVVVDAVEQIDAALQAANRNHAYFIEAQKHYLDDSIGQVVPGESSFRGADEIVSFLGRPS